MDNRIFLAKLRENAKNGSNSDMEYIEKVVYQNVQSTDHCESENTA